MIFSLLNFRLFLTLATAGCAIFCPANTRAAERPRARPIELSEPKSDEVTTNLNQLSRKDGLRQLEEDLYKPLKTFNPKSSLDGVLAPPMRPPSPQPVIQSKRVKELIERQKNWIFMNPDDLADAPKDADLFRMHDYDKDGQEKKKSSPLERFLEKQERERNPALKHLDSKDDDLVASRKRKDKAKDTSDEPEDAVFRGIRESEQSLKKLFDSDPSRGSLVPVSPASSFSDVFGLGAPLTDKTPTENPNITKYRQFLDSHSPVTGLDPFSSLPGVTPLSGAADPFSSKHDSFSPVLGAINPVTIPGLPDPKSLSQSPSPARIDPPKVVPPTPVFFAPQRKF